MMARETLIYGSLMLGYIWWSIDLGESYTGGGCFVQIKGEESDGSRGAGGGFLGWRRELRDSEL
jgi:hypothetical protein